MDIAALGMRVDSSGVVVAVDRLNDLPGAAARAERGVKGVEHSSRQAQGALFGLAGAAKNAAFGFLAMATATFGFAASIGQARQFNAAMAEVSTLLPDIPGQLDEITAASRRLATEFGGSATAQSQAFYQAISAGAGNAAAATRLLEIANRTAIGGVTDVTTAVDVLTTAQNAYAASGLTAADAADTLFVGMKAGKTTVGELAKSLGRVIPQATAVGLSFDEIVAATAALTTQGQSTNMAVTGLSGIMTQLLKPSARAVELAAELGIEFTATKAATMGLAEFMEYLVEASGGSQEVLAELFGSTESLRAVFSLAGQGGVKFNEILGQMEDRAGAADEAFLKVSKSLDQRLNVATAKFVDMALQAGVAALTVLVPALEGLLGVLGFLGDSIGDVRGYLVAAAVAATAYYTPAMIGLAASVMSAVFTLGVLKAALIATGIGAAVVAAGYLINGFLALSDAVGGFGNAMVYVKELGLEVLERLRLGGSALVEGYKGYTAGFVLLWRQTFATVINLFADFIDTILDGTRNAMLGVGNVAAAAAIEASRAAVRSTIGQMQDGANAAVETQQALVDQHFQAAQQMAKDALAPLYMWQALNDVIDASRQKAAGAAGAAPAIPGLPEDLLGGGVGSAASAGDNEEKYLDTIRREVEELGRLQQALRQGDEAYAAMAETIEIENVLREQKIRAGTKEAELIAEQVRQYNYLAAAIDAARNADLGGMSEADRTRSRERFEDLGKDLRSGIDNPLVRLREEYAERLKIVDEYQRAYKDKIAEAAAARLEIERQYHEAQVRLSLAAGQMAFGALAGAMRDVLGEQSAAYKSMFAIQQAFVIATAALNIQKAMSEALALPFPANLAAWGIVAANAAQIMSSVNSIALGFQSGGYTGNGGVGAVAGVVHGQEYVLNAAATRRIGVDNLDAMNRGVPMAANDNGGGRIALDINISVDDDGRIRAYVTNAQSEAVNAAVTISDHRTRAQMGAAQKSANRPVISARG